MLNNVQKAEYSAKKGGYIKHNSLYTLYTTYMILFRLSTGEF